MVDVLVVVVFGLFSELVIALLTITVKSAKSCIMSHKPETMIHTLMCFQPKGVDVNIRLSLP